MPKGKRPMGAIRLSDALREAKDRGWAVTPIRQAAVAGEIPSWRSSHRGRAWYYVQWADVEAYVNNLAVTA